MIHEFGPVYFQLYGVILPRWAREAWSYSWEEGGHRCHIDIFVEDPK